MRPGECLNALDGNRVGPGALDHGAHGNQTVGKIHHFGLARRILDDARTLGQRCRHHEILGAGHSNEIHYQSRALESLGAGPYEATLHLNIGTHLGQTVNVQIDRSRSYCAAARQRHQRFAVTRQKRTQHQNRRPHGFHELVGRVELTNAAGIHLDLHGFVNHQIDAHAPE